MFKWFQPRTHDVEIPCERLLHCGQRTWSCFVDSDWPWGHHRSLTCRKGWTTWTTINPAPIWENGLVKHHKASFETNQLNFSVFSTSFSITFHLFHLSSTIRKSPLKKKSKPLRGHTEIVQRPHRWFSPCRCRHRGSEASNRCNGTQRRSGDDYLIPRSGLFLTSL